MRIENHLGEVLSTLGQNGGFVVSDKVKLPDGRTFNAKVNVWSNSLPAPTVGSHVFVSGNLGWKNGCNVDVNGNQFHSVNVNLNEVTWREADINELAAELGEALADEDRF